MFHDEKRFFRYEHEGQEQWLAIPVFSTLITRAGQTKEVWQFEEGEEGRGFIELILTAEKIEVWFTCTEP